MCETRYRRTPRTAAALFFIGLIGGAPAAAQPVAYEGSIGDKQIVLELTDDPFEVQGEVEGRFSYLRDGSDVPLLFSRRDASNLILNEESPCAVAECEGREPAIAATWTLLPGKGPGEIIGQWQKASEIRRLTLRYLGTRARAENEEKTAYGLFSSSDQLSMSDEPIGSDKHPYEYAKLNVPIENAAPYDLARPLDFDGSVIAYVADPRTRFIWPRVERLANGSSPARVNGLLEQGRWRKNLAAFSCRSLRFMTLRGGDEGWTSDAGTLGGYDDTVVEVSFLSPHLLSYQESGSLWCGGASPTNFIKPVTIDVERGEEIAPSSLFTGWEDGAPPETLVALVRSRLSKDGEAMDGGGDCSFDNMSNYLTAYFIQSSGGRAEVRFGLYNLPTVAIACSRDLATFRVSEIAPYLTPEAVRLLQE